MLFDPRPVFMERYIKNNKIREMIGLIACTIIYLLWFFFLEKNIRNDYHVIHVGLDDYIPFCEFFIIPYLLWFVYVIALWAYFFHKEEETFLRMSRFLFGGMFISLFICTIYPNGTDLRPVIDQDENVFTWLCGLIWSADTPTNVLPSIHVYNSIGINIAVHKSQSFSDRPKLKIISTVMCIAICMSTVFLKQHSCADVLVAGILAYAMYQVVYDPISAAELKERSARRRRQLQRSTD